jgi:hypothetical protein
MVAVTGRGGPGSGYLVAPTLVLTSAHVVTEKGAPVEVFRPGWAGTVTGTVVWCGTAGGRDDAALVEVDDLAWQPLATGAVVWGHAVTHRPGIACEAWGVPNLVQRPGRAVDVVQLTGTLNPGDRLISNVYETKLDGFPPAGESPWGGMSGAALLSAGLVIGVIASEPENRSHAVLDAVPVWLLLRDPEFVAVVAAHTDAAAVRCEAIELRPMADKQAQVPAGRTIPSPAGLLPARRAVVPFHGRGELLADLTTWARQPGAGMWLLHGPGGQGKTRLAHQFAGQLAGQDWVTLWLSSDATDVSVLAEVRRPTLVVLDYAESRTTQLAAIADTLAAAPEPLPVKLLLLARTAGAWWNEALPAASEAARDLIDTAQVERLPILDGTSVDRLASYRVAVTAFAAALSRVPGYDTEPWAETATRVIEQAVPKADVLTVLAVQMTALADLLDAATVGTTTGAQAASGPEDRVLAHERGYWQSTATAQGLLPGLTAGVLADVVIAAVVLGPDTVEGVDRTVARVPGLADQPADRRAAARSWLLSVYPAGEDGGFEGLVPDRLAERLVGRAIVNTDRACVVPALAAHADQREAVRLLTVCTRAVAHTVFGEVAGERVTRWCVELSDTLLLAAVEVATRVEAPQPLVRAVDQVVTSDQIATAVLNRLLDAVPRRSQILGDVAAVVAQTLADRARQALAHDTPGDDSELARHLNNLSVRLAELGRREEALDAITEAVTVNRRLVMQRPDAHLSSLALSLNNLSGRLADLGRREEALDAITEAVTIRHRLAVQRPDAYLPDLAGSLNNLSLRLADLGRQEEALDANTEAVTTYRQLAVQHPDAYLPDLATGLNNLSNRLAELGRREEALDVITEAVTIRHQLAAQRPDSFLSDLAMSLTNLSNWLAELGREAEALDAITEAVAAYRRLAVQHPDAYLPNLALSLNNLAVRLADLGRQEEALDTITEAVTTYRQLAARHPDTYLPNLAGSLNNLSVRLAKLGREAEALDTITEAVAAYRRLAVQYPDAYLPNLATGLNNLSNWLAARNRRDEALDAITEAVTIQRRLASQRPDAYLSSLASSLNNLSDRSVELGHQEEALDAITEAVTIQRRLASQRPDAYLPNLAASLNNLSVGLVELGRQHEALDTITEAVTVYRRLAAQRPDAYLPNLAASLHNLAIAFGSVGQRQRALVFIREAVEIRSGLADLRPDLYLSDLEQSRRVLRRLTDEPTS